MVLIVLRHAQSSWNKENKFTGFIDIPLSFEGILQAQQAGNILKKYEYRYIL